MSTIDIVLDISISISSIRVDDDYDDDNVEDDDDSTFLTRFLLSRFAWRFFVVFRWFRWTYCWN